MNTSSIQSGASRRRVARHRACVAIAGLCAVACATAVQANETTGRVFGTAPAGATVQVASPAFAIQRNIQANAAGRYSVGWLPIGAYEVTMVDNGGQPQIKHASVPVSVDRGSRVDFACPDGQCADVAQN